MKRFIYWIYVVCLIVLASSCRSLRYAERTPMIGGLKGEEYQEKVISGLPHWNCVTGKVALNLNLDGGKNTKLSATLRMKKGEVIQLSVAPLLGIEVARLEISPDRILAVDRLHKQYVEVSFDELNRMANLNLSFNVLQSLFLNEIFLPGKETVEVSDLHRFRMTSEGDRALWEVKDTRKLAYRFRTTADKGWLESTSVALSGTPYALNWMYGDFGKLGTAYFPQHILAELQGTGKTYSLDMKLSRMSVGEDWETRTSLSSRYKKIELTTLLKMWLER